MVHKTCIVCGCDLGDVHGNTQYCFECNPSHQKFFRSKPSPIIQQEILSLLAQKGEMPCYELAAEIGFPKITCFKNLHQLRRKKEVDFYKKKVVPGRGRARVYWYLKRGSPNAHNNQG